MMDAEITENLLVDDWMLSFFGALEMNDFTTLKGIDRIINRGKNDDYRVEVWYWEKFDHIRIFVYERHPHQDHLIYQKHAKFSETLPFALGVKISSILNNNTNRGN